MKKQAILNYEKAKDYDEELLSKKRESFYRKYLKIFSQIMNKTSLLLSKIQYFYVDILTFLRLSIVLN